MAWWGSASDEAVGAVVFVVAGVLLLVATLLVEGRSASTAVGTVAAASILATGSYSAFPASKGAAVQPRTRGILRRTYGWRALLVSMASALGAIAVPSGSDARNLTHRPG